MQKWGGIIMSFLFSINGKLEIRTIEDKNVKIDALRDTIVSLLAPIQGCLVHTDNLNIRFKCRWDSIFRRSWGVLAGLSNGTIRLNLQETTLIIVYRISVIQQIVFEAVAGVFILFSMSGYLKNNLTPPISIGYPVLVTLWLSIICLSNLVIALRFRRFLKKCIRTAIAQQNSAE